MPLPTKVKSRISALAGCAAGLSLAVIIASDSDSEAPVLSLGDRAVRSPVPPILTPPVLDQATPRNTLIRIDLASQRLIFFVDGETAIDSPISTGRKNLETPAGNFVIEKKHASRKQSSYGNIVDASGNVIVAGVYADRDPVPSGLKFEPVTLQHLFDVKDQKFKIHAGAVGLLPVSDGSILVPADVAKVLFGKVFEGTPIEIIAEP